MNDDENKKKKKKSVIRVKRQIDVRIIAIAISFRGGNQN